MRRGLAYALLLCCLGRASADDNHQHSDQLNPNELQDPTAVTHRLEQVMTRVKSTPNRAHQHVVRSDTNDDLQDPTRMNQNFRDALDHSVKQNPASAGTATTALTPELPDIRLVATIFDNVKEKTAVMLRVNGQSELARQGEKITAMGKNKVMTIEIVAIEQGSVTITVMPINETIILR